MKKIFLSIFMLHMYTNITTQELSLSTTDAIESLLMTNFNFGPEEFSNFVFRRYYFIKRLKKTINLFNKINKTIKTNNPFINPQKIFEFDPSISFKHYRIQESIEQIKEKKNFKPLFRVWQDFIAYKSLDDQLFIEEFTKEIYVISKNVFLNTKPKKSIYKRLLTTKTVPFSTEQLLTEIDTFSDGILTAQSLPFHFYNKILQKNSSFKPLAHINDIVIYFYYIKRLSPCMFSLFFLHNKGYLYQQKNFILKKKSIFIDSVQFSHARIVSCIKAMNITTSLNPLLLLLRELKQYRYIQDAHFLHEMMLLLFVIHKHIFLETVHNGTVVPNKSVFTSIMIISETIDQLPIAEVLNAIDMLVEELPVFLEKYEFHSTMTWKKWLRKYWWVPPALIIWFGLKTLVKLQHRPSFFSSSFYQPKPPMPAPITTNDPALLELIS